jgi:hypothetical protein
VALLGLDAQGRDGTGLQTLYADRLVGFLAIAVGAVLDPPQGIVDLGDQLPLPVPGAQLKRPVGLQRGPVGDIRLGQAFLIPAEAQTANPATCGENIRAAVDS